MHTVTLHAPSPAPELLCQATPDARPRNLLEVKMRLADAAISAAKRSDLVSALNAIARSERRPEEKGFDQALARISVDPRILIARLDRCVGARLGYTRESWSNVGWRVRQALKLTGAWLLYRRRKIAQSPAWEVATGRAPKRSRIRLLGGWATLEGIAPEQLGDEHLPLFLNWLQTWKRRQYALRCYFAALAEWNAAARTPGWPGRAVNVLTRLSGHYSVAVEDWSPELLRDIDRVIAVFRNPDLDEMESNDPISEKTAKAYRERVLRTLSAYVAAQRIEPSSVKSVAELLAPTAAKSALDFMLGWIRRRKPEALRTSEIHDSAKLLSTIAERCYSCEISADNILALRKMARNRAPVRHGMSDKNRELLKLFDDEQFIARFLALPFGVFARLLNRPVLRRVDAVKLMLAFAVALATEAPLRPENQASLIVGRQICKRKEGGVEVLAIRVPANEVKNSHDLDFELSGDIVELYDVYMREVRPLIGTTDSPYLYPGSGVGPKAPGSLSPQVARFIEDELGVHMTGQQFRHAIGYLYLKANPGDYEVVRQLLGHKDITTTMAFYASLDMRAASKKVSTFIAERRAHLVPLLRKRRRGPKNAIIA